MTTDEQAKATEEVAKTTGKFAEIAEKVGGFISKVIGPASNQVGGVLEDWTRYFRFRNLLGIGDKVEAIHAQRKVQGKTMPISPRIAIPMLESAALEDDETLQDVWARLIANSTDPKFEAAIHPGYIEIVKQLSPDEAVILQSFLKLESYPILFKKHFTAEYGREKEMALSYFWTMQGRQESYMAVLETCISHCRQSALKKPEDAQVYIDNLIRLRIIELGHNFSGEEQDAHSFIFKTVHRTRSKEENASVTIPARDEFLRVTAFGQSFMMACISDTPSK